jgi:mannonate dehydratase
MVRRGLLPREFVSPLKAIRVSNPLLFDFALKRLLRFGEHRFPVSIFETRRFFERNSA